MFTLAFFLIFLSTYALYNCSKRVFHTRTSFNYWVTKRVKKTQFTSIIFLWISYVILQFIFGFGKGFFVFISILILINSLLIILIPLQIIKAKILFYLFVCCLVIEYSIPYFNAC